MLIGHCFPGYQEQQVSFLLMQETLQQAHTQKYVIHLPTVFPRMSEIQLGCRVNLSSIKCYVSVMISPPYHEGMQSNKMYYKYDYTPRGISVPLMGNY